MSALEIAAAILLVIFGFIPAVFAGLIALMAVIAVLALIVTALTWVVDWILDEWNRIR